LDRCFEYALAGAALPAKGRFSLPVGRLKILENLPPHVAAIDPGTDRVHDPRRDLAVSGER
jgi:hypothetical protein